MARVTKGAIVTDCVDQPAEGEIEEPMTWDELPAEVAERRQAVVDLRRRGLPVTMMARILKVSERTIKRDLAWIRTAHGATIRHFVPEEFVGEALALFREIEAKCMVAAETAISREEEGLVKVMDGEKAVWKSLKKGPDHVAANRHLMAALRAREAQASLLIETGILKAAALEVKHSGPYGLPDVSRLHGQELTDEVARLERRNRELDEVLRRMERNPLEEARKASLTKEPN